jgi:adenylate kinase family enzyme
MSFRNEFNELWLKNDELEGGKKGKKEYKNELNKYVFVNKNNLIYKNNQKTSSTVNIKKKNSKDENLISYQLSEPNLDNLNISKTKMNNNINSIENINEELEKIINESIEGFILYDYPNNYNQFQKLENMLTGFIQEIDKNPDKRDIYMNILTNYIDKPYINISNINREVSSFLNKNNLHIKSFFNCYILLELSEEETLKRMNNRLKDPNTDIIYHKEYSPPNPSDKKLIERLVPLNEPNDDTIKELITHFYSEYPDIIYFLHLFNNLYRIDLEDKNEIFKKIENIILGEIKKYEERENKDIIINNNYEFNDENEIMRYFKRLNETKKYISKELSEDIIKIWNEQQDKYLLGIKHFLSNFIELKNNFIEQMNIYQEEFIDYLNNSSKKYKLVDIFYKKYNILLEKYPFLKNIHLVKEEFNRNIIELIDHIWELIQMKKRDSISELNNIKNQNFIDNQLEIFGEYIINLIILETNHYYKKINIITKFYYEFERSKISDKFPYEYIFNKEFILENINELPIFTSDLNLNSQQSKSSISPKIEKIYNNCHKLLFDYDKTMIALNKKK